MSVSMSRFIYTTETYNGSILPASAYVLWPYLPRTFPGLTPCSCKHDGPLYPVIALAHGTSGKTQACAPSQLRAPWDDFHKPFPMALAGYAVVATDYLGLRIANTTSPYFVLPSQANGLVCAVEAARRAWPNSLSKGFVVAGQSQGCGVSWSVAQRQVETPVEKYLGIVAASPFTNVLGSIAADNLAEDNARVVAIAQGLKTVRPNFEISEWITDAGIARLKLLQEIQGCGGAAIWYNTIASNGGKPVAGPLFIMQGDSDPNAYEPTTTAAVKQTCKLYPDSQIQYSRWESLSHVPVLYAGQHLMLDFIHDRFAGVTAPAGCLETNFTPSRGMASANFDWFADQTWFEEFQTS